MNEIADSAPETGQDWLDHLLRTGLVEVPDEGFSRKIMFRIRIRRLSRVLTLGGAAAMGVWLAVALGAVDGLLRMLDVLTRTITPERFSFLNNLPLPEMPQFPAASDFTNPIVLGLIVAMTLIWLFREEA